MGANRGGEVDAKCGSCDKREGDCKSGGVAQLRICVIKGDGALQVACDKGDSKYDREAHDVRIVEKADRVQIKVAHDSFDRCEIGGRECVVGEDECVSDEGERDIAEGRDKCAKGEDADGEDDCL